MSTRYCPLFPAGCNYIKVERAVCGMRSEIETGSAACGDPFVTISKAGPKSKVRTGWRSVASCDGAAALGDFTYNLLTAKYEICWQVQHARVSGTSKQAQTYSRHSSRHTLPNSDDGPLEAQRNPCGALDARGSAGIEAEQTLIPSYKPRHNFGKYLKASVIPKRWLPELPGLIY